MECFNPDCKSVGVTKTCSGCKTVFYCNEECQLKNWPDHKPFCKAHQRHLRLNNGNGLERADANKEKLKNLLQNKYFMGHVIATCEIWRKTVLQHHGIYVIPSDLIEGVSLDHTDFAHFGQVVNWKEIKPIMSPYLFKDMISHMCNGAYAVCIQDSSSGYVTSMTCLRPQGKLSVQK